MADEEELAYDLFFDEADEFMQTELEHMEAREWDSLLTLYERELDHIEDEDDANALRSRIETIRNRMYEESQDAEKY